MKSSVRKTVKFIKLTNAVAEDEAVRVYVVIVLGGEDAVFAAGGHAEDALDVLLILVLGLKKNNSFVHTTHRQKHIPINLPMTILNELYS